MKFLLIVALLFAQIAWAESEQSFKQVKFSHCLKGTQKCLLIHSPRGDVSMNGQMMVMQEALLSLGSTKKNYDQIYVNLNAGQIIAVERNPKEVVETVYDLNNFQKASFKIKL